MGLVPQRNYEDLLGDALETALGRGARELDEIVAVLGELCLQSPTGQRWTATALSEELARLACGEGAHARASSRPVISQPFNPPAATPEDVLRTGLLEMWYLVASSADVADRPKALRRLGRNLVLWRDTEGQVRAIEDYCPHRGAPLSLGRIVDGRLSCAYHGFEIDAAGAIAAVPGSPDCPLIGQKAVHVYPVREIADAVWVYFSADPHANPPGPELPDELVSPEWTHFLFTTEWHCNWQTALENRVDPLHGSYLHTDTFTLAYGRKDTELDVTKTEHGFETRRNNQQGINIDWHEVIFRPGNILMVRTDIPYPPSIGGGSFRINGHPTPIDEETTFVWFFRSRKLSGWRRDLWRFLYVNRLEARAQEVVEQDRVMLEAIPREAHRREKLVQSDIAVGRIRRLLREEAARQLSAGQGLPGLDITVSSR